ncbi:MAG: DUF1569 domain-containing protein [Gemmatimonadaceae bacterium]
MPKTIHDAAARHALMARLDRLEPITPARWGRFTAPKMVAHLISAVRMALGEEPAAPIRSYLGNRVVRWLVIYVAPWPKGAPTAPEMLARAPESWAADIATLKSALDQAAANGQHGTWAPHPAFGTLSGGDWGVLLHKHVHHHLTQFGA